MENDDDFVDALKKRSAPAVDLYDLGLAKVLSIPYMKSIERRRGMLIRNNMTAVLPPDESLNLVSNRATLMLLNWTTCSLNEPQSHQIPIKKESIWVQSCMFIDKIDTSDPRMQGFVP